jgi:hypothetical protein
MFFGPLGGLGALGVMNELSHTEDAESAKNEDAGGKFRRYTQLFLASFA